MNKIPYFLLRSAYSTCRTPTLRPLLSRSIHSRVNPLWMDRERVRVNPLWMNRERRGRRVGVDSPPGRLGLTRVFYSPPPPLPIPCGRLWCCSCRVVCCVVVVLFLSCRVLCRCGAVLVVPCVVLFLLCVCVCDLFLLSQLTRSASDVSVTVPRNFSCTPSHCSSVHSWDFHSHLP